jgi:D-psicose/D-tagatose/L-ribulose 3-epimerase
MGRGDRMKISICNELFQGWPIEKVFDYAARLGYDGVELAPFTLAESVRDVSMAERKRISKAAESAGIEIVGLHWLLVKPGGLSINHPDGEVRKRTQDYLRELINFCGDLGGKVLVHGSPKQRTVQEGWDPSEAWKRAHQTWEVCAKMSERQGILYCLEPLSPADTNFINTADEALRMVQEIGHPNLKIAFDCRSASLSEGAPLPQVLNGVLRNGNLGHVHVNDPNGRGPGFGELQFPPVLRTLIDGGYQGYVSVEVFDFEPDPETIASRSIGYLRGIYEALGHYSQQD